MGWTLNHTCCGLLHSTNTFSLTTFGRRLSIHPAVVTRISQVRDIVVAVPEQLEELPGLLRLGVVEQTLKHRIASCQHFPRPPLSLNTAYNMLWYTTCCNRILHTRYALCERLTPVALRTKR